MSVEKEWNYEDTKPKKEDIYAVLYCWDINEGRFDGALAFDGIEWSKVFKGNAWVHTVPVTAFCDTPFDTCDLAACWASENNPDWT